MPLCYLAGEAFRPCKYKKSSHIRKARFFHDHRHRPRLLRHQNTKLFLPGRHNDDVEEAEDDGQEDEVTGEDEETEDAQPDDTPEEAEEAEDATETCEDDNADDGSAVDADAESSARPQWE